MFGWFSRKDPEAAKRELERATARGEEAVDELRREIARSKALMELLTHKEDK